jgi:hypothetical protein
MVVGGYSIPFLLQLELGHSHHSRYRNCFLILLRLSPMKKRNPKARPPKPPLPSEKQRKPPCLGRPGREANALNIEKAGICMFLAFFHPSVHAGGSF